MSSTNRGATRSPNDFYRTDPGEIVRFIDRWRTTDPEAETFFETTKVILDPAAGGLTEQVVIEQPQKDGKKPKPPLVFEPSRMSYPTAIERMFPNRHIIATIDIRDNSCAASKEDFLGTRVGDYDMVITNPPFSLAIEFIQHALKVVRPGGYVVMLLRLNFFGSEDRNAFFMSSKMPQLAYVHSRRLGFTPDGKTDSIEYMHAIWKKTGELNDDTILRVLPY